jgi:putative ABC transport system permease protein
VFSFLGESIFLSILSLVIAILLVIFVLRASPFNQLIDRNLAPDFIHNPILLFGSLGIALAIGIISGLYPAFYLPGIPTIKALKGSFKNQKSSLLLRKILTTSQFAISIFVVVCTLFMDEQIKYMRNKELGFNKENIVVLSIQDTLVQRQIGSIKNEFLQNPHITAATTSYNIMGMNVGGNSVMWAESEVGMKQQAFTMMYVGDEYLKTLGMQIVNGRDFQLGPKADIDGVFIANEAAVKLMGWGKDPIGKKVKGFHAQKDGQVIGVVKDFNFSSLHNPIEPLLMVKADNEGGFLHLKVKGQDLSETLDFIKKKWLTHDPNHPFEFFFLDQRFNEQYKTDETQHKLLSGLSWICIFISLLGLLGLSAFSATQRTKEIGVRKVHGASISQIIYLLFKEVMYLVIIASILIIPLSHYVINGWVGNFAYHTSVNYGLFAMVFLFALLFTFVTVAFHGLKTAHSNPVKSLRSE